MPARVYVVNGLVAGGLNLLLAAALGHPLGWVLSAVVIPLVVAVPLSWSYVRRSERASRAHHDDSGTIGR